ncbi:MAG TPA: hypothetical protein VFH68_20310 [Polyangia bacterium]|nr:hypothetical protein [Polyangia bacterium]
MPPSPSQRAAPGAAQPPAAAGGAAAPAGPLGDAEWSQRYVQARASMLAGRFAEAAAQFAALVSSGREESQQILAREQADICDRWARGGFVLLRAADLPAAQARAAESLLDRRSVDELGILYTASVLYGLGTGLTLDFWTEPSSAAGAILPALALGGGAAGLVYMLDRPQELRYGVAQSITSGMWIGLEEALAWTLWNQARANYYDEWSGRTVATVLWVTATAGAVLGGTLGTAYGTTPGRASLMGSTALWSGLVVGLLGASAVGDSPTADDSFLLLSALGLNGGAVAGVIIGKDVSPSIARVRFLDLGALTGGILAGGVYLAASNGHPSTRVLTGALAAGITGGLVTAWQLTGNMEPDHPRGRQDAAPPAEPTLIPSISPSASRGGASGVDGLVLGVTGAF